MDKRENISNHPRAVGKFRTSTSTPFPSQFDSIWCACVQRLRHWSSQCHFWSFWRWDRRSQLCARGNFEFQHYFWLQHLIWRSVIYIYIFHCFRWTWKRIHRWVHPPRPFSAAIEQYWTDRPTLAAHNTSWHRSQRFRQERAVAKEGYDFLQKKIPQDHRTHEAVIEYQFSSTTHSPHKSHLQSPSYPVSTAPFLLTYVSSIFIISFTRLILSASHHPFLLVKLLLPLSFVRLLLIGPYRIIIHDPQNFYHL